MTDRFDKWINGMSDEEFEDRIASIPSNGGFSDRQEEIALNIRQPASEQELADLERQQEGTIPVAVTPTTDNIVVIKNIVLLLIYLLVYSSGMITKTRYEGKTTDQILAMMQVYYEKKIREEQ